MSTPFRNACGYVYVPRRSIITNGTIPICSCSSTESDSGEDIEEDPQINEIVNMITKEVKKREPDGLQIKKITVMQF